MTRSGAYTLAVVVVLLLFAIAMLDGALRLRDALAESRACGEATGTLRVELLVAEAERNAHMDAHNEWRGR